MWPRDVLSQPKEDKARVLRLVVGSFYRPGFIGVTGEFARKFR